MEKNLKNTIIESLIAALNKAEYLERELDNERGEYTRVCSDEIRYVIGIIKGLEEEED